MKVGVPLEKTVLDAELDDPDLLIRELSVAEVVEWVNDRLYYYGMGEQSPYREAILTVAALRDETAESAGQRRELYQVCQAFWGFDAGSCGYPGSGRPAVVEIRRICAADDPRHPFGGEPGGRRTAGDRGAVKPDGGGDAGLVLTSGGAGLARGRGQSGPLPETQRGRISKSEGSAVPPVESVA